MSVSYCGRVSHRGPNTHLVLEETQLSIFETLQILENPQVALTFSIPFLLVHIYHGALFDFTPLRILNSF